MVTSPLTGSGDVSLVRTFKTDRLVERWKAQTAIDVKSEFNGHSEVHLYQCKQTRLRFFYPDDVAGTAALYKELQKIEWYYREEKWEYERATEDLRGGGRILEVGCGEGAFVEKLMKMPSVTVEGIELTPAAVKAAQERNLPVTIGDVIEIAKERPASYDAVCSFQVLEHIARPLPFLQAMTTLLKPGGKLLIGVPNDDGFLRHDDTNIFNIPPHHMGRWSSETFRRLSTILPLQVDRICHETLFSGDSEWFMRSKLGRLSTSKLYRRMSDAVAQRLGKFIRNRPNVLKRFQGQTLYVCLRRT